MRRLTVLVPAILLCACSDDPPPPETRPSTTVTPQVTAPAPAATKPSAPDAAGAWRMRIVREKWWPTLITGSFVLRRDDPSDRWTGDMVFDQLGFSGAIPFDSVEVADGRVRMSVSPAGEPYVIDAELHAADLEGTIRWSDHQGIHYVEPFHGERPFVRRFESAPSAAAFPVAEDPSAVGIDPLQLDRLLVMAGDADTDALVVVKDGKLVCERYFGRTRGPIEIYSVTKAVASLAVPFLVDEGRIASIDEPMSGLFPQWAGDERSTITLRNVLTHTSGLETKRSQPLQRQEKAFEFALASPCAYPPGTRVEYSNVAFATLGGYVGRASGESLDTYLGKRVFEPLGVSSARWTKDAAGIPKTWLGLEIEAVDLAKIGWMLCEGGVWNGRRVLPEWWTKEFRRPGHPLNPGVGLAWWLRHDFRDEAVVQTPESLRACVAGGFVAAEKLAPLNGVRFASASDYWREVRARKLLGETDARSLPDSEGMLALYDVVAPPSGFFHSGSYGQYLLVYPEQHLVVVRLVAHRPWFDDDRSAAARLGFRRLEEAVEAMFEHVRRIDPPPAQPSTSSAVTPSAPVTDDRPAVLLDEEGWTMAGGARHVYRVRSDPETRRDGRPTVLLEPIADTMGRYGTWERDVPAIPYRGKRVRLSGFVKTQGATQRADFWARVQGANSPGDGMGLGGQRIALGADSDWTRYEVVLDVDRAGAWLQYAVGIAGPGKLWFDEARLEIVGDDVPVTTGPSPPRSK